MGWAVAKKEKREERFVRGDHKGEKLTDLGKAFWTEGYHTMGFLFVLSHTITHLRHPLLTFIICCGAFQN